MSTKDFPRAPQLKAEDSEIVTTTLQFESASMESIPKDSTNVDRINNRADMQELFLPISGFVWLHPEELAIVNHPAFQRLSRIYQLGQAYLVFRGATHKRVEHVIGALHVVDRMISAVQINSEKNMGDPRWAPPLSSQEIRFVRLGTLLHDIGHIVAGHTVEDELELVSKHDGDQRLDSVLNGSVWSDRTGRTLAKLIDEQYDRLVPEDLRNHNVAASTIVRLLIRKPPKDKEADSYKVAQAHMEKSNNIRLEACRYMIGNTICADFLDYIHRDWYHVGKPRPFDDRLLQYMEVRRGAQEAASKEPRASDKFVISLRERPKIRTDAVSHILDLLEWRYSLAETVLFHRTKLAAAAMLDRALYELWGDSDREDEIVNFLLPLSDEEMLRKCRDYIEELRKEKKLPKERSEALDVAFSLLLNLERREIFSHLSTRFAGDLPGDRVVSIKATYARVPGDSKAASKNRNSVVRALEQDFHLKRGALAMYCPAAMNRKVAEVQIAVGTEIEKFSDYETKHDGLLAGGHLDAQLRRFDRLWRVHFFIDREAKESLGDKIVLLQQAVDKLALGNFVDDESGERVALSLAKLLVQSGDPKWAGYKVSDTQVQAKSGDSAALENYPIGAPSIRRFLYR